MIRNLYKNNERRTPSVHLNICATGVDYHPAGRIEHPSRGASASDSWQ